MKAETNKNTDDISLIEPFSMSEDGSNDSRASTSSDGYVVPRRPNEDYATMMRLLTQVLERLEKLESTSDKVENSHVRVNENNRIHRDDDC